MEPGTMLAMYAGQTVSNAGGGLLGGWMNKRAQDRAWNRNKKMWHMQNAYNHPAQQIARLKEAGLAPQLLYGNGVQASGNSGQLPKYQAEQYHITPIDTANIRLAGAQTELARSQAAINREEKVIRELNKKFEYWKKFGIIAHPYSNIEMEDGQIIPDSVEARQHWNAAGMSEAQKKKYLQETENLTKEAPFYKLKGDLAKQGMNISDPILMRSLYTIAKDAGWLDNKAMILALLAQMSIK
jgi:hypothetical protein